MSKPTFPAIIVKVDNGFEVHFPDLGEVHSITGLSFDRTVKQAGAFLAADLKLFEARHQRSPRPGAIDLSLFGLDAVLVEILPV